MEKNICNVSRIIYKGALTAKTKQVFNEIFISKEQSFSSMISSSYKSSKTMEHFAYDKKFDKTLDIGEWSV